MSDSAVTIVAIFLAAILMFVFPLMTMADKTDDVSTLTVQTATNDITSKVRTTGRFTQEDYDNFILSLASTGNAYDVEIIVQKKDENPAKKKSNGTATIGDNVYYTMYTTQVLESLPMDLQEGDNIAFKVTIKSKTLANQLRNYMYKVTGDSTGGYIAQSSGMITKTSN